MENKLFIVYSNLNPGGIPAKIIDIVNRLAETDPNLMIQIILQKGHVDDFRSLIKNPQAEISDFRQTNSVCRRIKFTLWLWKLILVEKPKNILVFISPYALPVLAAKILLFWRRINVIVSEDHYTATMINSMAYPALQKTGIDLLYPLADNIIAVSGAVRNQLVNRFSIPVTKIKVVPNWSRFSDTPIPDTPRPIDIIYIGRLVASKNLQEIIETMHKYIRKNNHKIKCMIVGDGPEKNKLNKYISIHKLKKYISLVPAVKNVSKFLLKSKVLLFLPEPSTEGFPIILLDAMACGCMVVTSGFEGLNDVVKSNKNGFIITQKNESDNLIAKIFSRSKSCKPIIKAAKQAVLKHHSKKNIDSYIELLK